MGQDCKSDDAKLAAKIEILKVYEGHVIAVESRYMNMFYFVSLIFGAFTLWGKDFYPDKIPNLVFIIIPIICLFSVSSIAFFSRESAMMQGYIAAIEEKVNEEIGGNYFVYRSQIIGNYYHPKHFIANGLNGILLEIPLLILSWYSFTKLYGVEEYNKFYITIYVLIFILVGFILFYVIATNHRIRAKIQAFVVTNATSKKSE